MQIVRLVVLMLLLCGLPAGAFAQQQSDPHAGLPTQTVPLVSLRLGVTPFEIARPATWVEGPVQGPEVLASWIHPYAELYPNLNVTLEALPQPGEAGVQQLYDSLKELPGFTEERAEWQNYNGIRAHRSTIGWGSFLGDLKAARLLIPWDKKVLVVTFVDLKETFPLNQLAFDRCLDALAPFEELIAK